ncbi:Predicted oxidoreductase [Alkalithermobacter thermoalcaliphilus JW-YL-7 = DSM 7308]|uniref:NADP-dependent oxidoreductase domain containing protein n=1 Tax=Alkalithermobacter thermoalcaliphilus JW-YL-7 = DSM 7308 TaxID=1121328 RepID=A0A150FQQ3_CLOPD|nr:NADP-dependent oxidoreductase domain containing protein [[Clostridium] paradoxum JW-YL-7 = DSM 7308]SHK76256.1 Predicted oxidoreductase [[Clostridium] paradoxum JW-YL-7 = DSM 7308]
MRYNVLGKTGLKVSNICFGALTIGPLQKNMTKEEGSKVILEALERGINFIDTAQLYGTYPHIKQALKSYKRENVVIITKSYAYSKETAQESLKEALKEMGTDYVDGFLLHEQESEHTIRGHYEALEFFIKMKEKGYIRSVGISTHNVSGVKDAIKFKEIDVIHPIVNKQGIGIHDGTIDEMIEAIRQAKKNNIGIYAMKPLGGGNLIYSYDEAMDFVLSLDIIDSIAIGMQSKEEVIANILKVEGKIIPDDIKRKLNNKKRHLQIASWCIGCNACVQKCSHKALKIVNEKAVVDPDKCVLCGYCSKYCKDFCIKVI